MPILGLQTLAPSLQSVTPVWPPAMAPTYWRSLIYLLLNSSYSGRKVTQFSVSQSTVLCYCFDSMYCRCLFNSSLWRTEVRWRTGGRCWSQQDVSRSLSQSPRRDEASHLQRRPELRSGKFRVQRLPWSLEVLINVVCDFRTGLYNILSLLIILQPLTPIRWGGSREATKLAVLISMFYVNYNM